MKIDSTDVILKINEEFIKEIDTATDMASKHDQESDIAYRIALGKCDAYLTVMEFLKDLMNKESELAKETTP